MVLSTGAEDLFRGPEVRVSQQEKALRSVHSEGWKLIVPYGEEGPAPQLYSLVDDAGETQDRAADEPDRVAELRRRLEWYLSTHPAGPAAVQSSVDAAAVEELRALGYLGR